MTRMIHHRPFWEPFAMPTEAAAAAHRSWGWLMAFGILTLLIGCFAIVYDAAATLVTVLFVGWLTIFGGLAQAFAAFYARQWSGFFLHLAAGVLAFFVGILLLTHPGLGALALTLLMASYFLVSGVFRILAAATIRFEHWGWALINGLITLALGVLIWAQWPVSAFWVLGLFFGIDLILSGWTLISISLAARRLPAGNAPPAAFA